MIFSRNAPVASCSFHEPDDEAIAPRPHAQLRHEVGVGQAPDVEYQV